MRVHSKIAYSGAWARFWYQCRALDFQGRGIVELPTDTICQLNRISKPTLYEWLRVGREAGAFRRYRSKGNKLIVYLGGLHKVCLQQAFSSWGAVGEIPITEIFSSTSLKQVACQLETQELQHKSFVASRRALNKRERKFFQTPDACQILNQVHQTSNQRGRPIGATAGLVHIGERRVFVNKLFIPYGTSQQAIADSLGVTDRTIRNHQQGIFKRQVCQTKDAYTQIFLEKEWWPDSCPAEANVWCRKQDDENILLFEPNGITSATREGGDVIPRRRFFRYRGRTWLYRTNIYNLDRDLIPMKTARRNYNKLRSEAIEQLESAAVQIPTPSNCPPFFKRKRGGIVKRGGGTRRSRKKSIICFRPFKLGIYRYRAAKLARRFHQAPLRPNQVKALYFRYSDEQIAQKFRVTIGAIAKARAEMMASRPKRKAKKQTKPVNINQDIWAEIRSLPYAERLNSISQTDLLEWTDSKLAELYQVNIEAVAQLRAVFESGFEVQAEVKEMTNKEKRAYKRAFGRKETERFMRFLKYPHEFPNWYDPPCPPEDFSYWRKRLGVEPPPFIDFYKEPHYGASWNWGKL